MATAANHAFTFLHAADLHLDSPLRGLSSYPGAPVERLRGATRQAFEQLVDEALAREVAFVILAGDIFDGDWPDYASGLWFAAELRRLGTIPVFVIRGNHDAASKITRSLSWPDHVTVFPEEEATTVRLPEFDVAIHGQSYVVPHVEENLALKYPAAVPGAFNIGVLHTGLEGYEGHGHYAPCTLPDLLDKRYDYWALGHIHRREVLCEDPWIVFPGNLQGRHVREPGAKSATLVHVADGAVVGLEEVFCDVARWAVVEWDCASVDSDVAALERASGALAGALDAATDRILAVRVVARGRTELDGWLRTHTEHLSNELRARAANISSDLWVERLVVETAPLETGARASGDDDLGNLVTRLERAELDEAELDALTKEFRKLANKLPAAVRTELDPAHPATLAAALPNARAYLSALLAPSVADDVDELDEADDA
ncbi:MAG: DNA repair exonuclease [Planctomycetota bacterium]